MEQAGQGEGAQAEPQLVAVVTGGNKGIGYEIASGLCRRWGRAGAVYLTARSEERGRAAVERLRAQGLEARYHPLDVTSAESVRRLAEHVRACHAGLDVLVNNAGVLDFDKPVSAHEDCRRLIETNFYSLLSVSEALYPLLRDGARVVNVSSDWGLLSNIRRQTWLDRLARDDLTRDDILEFVDEFLQAARDGKQSFVSFAGHYGDYKVSKVAMSALTFVQQREFDKQGRNVSINCVHPGFVKTDMTKGMGDFTPERGARAPLYLALDAPQTLKGSFVWHDCKSVNWDD